VSTADHPLSRPEWQQARRTALLVAAAGVVAFVVVGAVLYSAGRIPSTRQFFQSYLVGYLFWLGAGLGCLVLLMVQHVTGGAWGVVLRRVVESGSRTLWLLALLFLPVAAGTVAGLVDRDEPRPAAEDGRAAAEPVLHGLYLWAEPVVVAHDAELQEKVKWYLNVPFFLGRAVGFFAVWLLFAAILNRWSLEQDANAAFPPRRFRLVSGPGLLLYGFTITFASIDWVMSLNPTWYSTIFPPLFATGQVLTGLAFAITVLLLLAAHQPLSGVLYPQLMRDLGNLLLAFVMLWAYMSFSQFLLVWVGNLPEETPWYLRRGVQLREGWTDPYRWVALTLLVLHFAVPFLLLLQRDIKEKRRWLAAIAVGVMALHCLDVFWWVEPAYPHEGYFFWLLDLAAVAAVGGLWVYCFLGELKTRPLLPANDPGLPRVLEHALPSEGTVS
jgi:hypothetical protein